MREEEKEGKSEKETERERKKRAGEREREDSFSATQACLAGLLHSQSQSHGEKLLDPTASSVQQA